MACWAGPVASIDAGTHRGDRLHRRGCGVGAVLQADDSRTGAAEGLSPAIAQVVTPTIVATTAPDSTPTVTAP